MTDIVSATVYVTSLDDVANMNKVYIALMPDPKPRERPCRSQA